MFRKIIIITAWGLAGLVVVFGTILLVAYGTGYSYDFAKHRLVRNGLILLESDPAGARVGVNGKDTRQKTPYRKTFEQGDYTFSLSREGYRPWGKKITLVATEVSLAQYVLLFEDKLRIEDIASYPAVSIFTPSIDHRHIAYVVDSGENQGVWALNTASHSRVKIYSPRLSAADQPPEIVRQIVWSDDGSHLLLQTAIGGKINWVVVSDNGRENPINISQKFGFEFPDLKFNPQNWRELYWLSEQGLRRLNITDNNLSGVLATSVVDFGFADDRVVYVDKSKPQYSLWALERSGRKVELDSKIPNAPHYQIISAKFRGVPKIGVLPETTREALIFHDPFGANFGPQVALIGVSAIHFSADGQFLGGLQGPIITTYGVEKGKLWRHASATESAEFVSWLDNHHYIYNRSGNIVVSEFDGANSTDLLPASPLPSISSADGRYILTVTKTPAGAHKIQAIRIRQ